MSEKSTDEIRKLSRALPAALVATVVVAGWAGLTPSNTVHAGAARPDHPAALVQNVVVPAGPDIELTPDAGPPGQVVAINGDGWVGNLETSVHAYWGVDGPEMASSNLEIDDGELSGTATIPVDATLGDESIEVCAEYGDGVDSDTTCAQATFSVERQLVVDPLEGQRGTVVELTGRWAARASADVPATVVWESTGEPLGPALISRSGRITATASIPLAAAEGAGAIAVCIGPPSARRVCVDTDFEVLPPTLDRHPEEILRDENLRLTGAGWCCPDAAVTVVNASTGEKWGDGTIDDAGDLTADATAPGDAVEGIVELDVCAREDCLSTAVFVIVQPTITTTTTSPPTTTSTSPTTTTSPSTTIVTTTTEPDDGGVEREAIIVAALIGGGGAGLVVTTVLWRRARTRHRKRARVVLRPDAGRQSVLGHDGPAITVSAVLDIGHQKPALHFRRSS
jgi:hypothetical protein